MKTAIEFRVNFDRGRDGESSVYAYETDGVKPAQTDWTSKYSRMLPPHMQRPAGTGEEYFIFRFLIEPLNLTNAVERVVWAVTMGMSENNTLVKIIG